MNSLKPLNLPAYPFRIRSLSVKTEIFDEVRRRWVALTPEEWVRQHFLMFLKVNLGYPLSLLSVEKKIQVNQLVKRFDIAVFDRSGTALMLIECKAPEIAIKQDVIDQAGRYNLSLNVPYLVVTNGIKHLCFMIDKKNCTWKLLDHIPDYEKLF